MRIAFAVMCLLVLAALIIGAHLELQDLMPSSTYYPNSTTSHSYTVNIANKSGIGEYLTSASGLTLYTYTQDSPNSSSSSCTGECVAIWPAFYSANITVPSGISKSKFGTITGTNGSKQTTYDGYPLYFYVGDNKAGQTNGQNVGGFVVATVSGSNST